MQDVTSNRTLYRALKLLHLISLVAWLGPSTGGYILLTLARLKGGTAEALQVLPGYITLVDIEATGLVVLILSGFAMRYFRPAYKDALWLRRKLLIVQYIFIPLEVANLCICHFILSAALEGKEGIIRALLIYDRFSILSAVLLGAGLPAVLILAVFKPWGRKD